MVVLTKGSIQSIIKGEKPEKPVLEITNFKVLPSGNARFRLQLSDGETNHSYVMVGAQLNEKFESNEIGKGSCIQLNEYLIKKQQDRTIIMLLNVTKISSDVKENIPVQTNVCPNVFVPAPTNPTPRQTTTIVSQHAGSKATPINCLNSFQNKWRIEGRVIQKAAIKHYNNAKGPGKLFSFVICDETCDIKVAAFNAEVDKFYDMIQIGKTYSISKGILKQANRQYNQTKCDFELSLVSDSEILEIEDLQNVPQLTFNFVGLNSINKKDPGSFIDVVGVAHEIGETTIIMGKTNNKEYRKRELVLVDQSGSSIRLTLWNDSVDMVENLQNPVVVVKGVQVTEFSGRSLSTASNSILLLNPVEIPEAMTLTGWYQTEGSLTQFQTQMAGSSISQPSGKISELSEINIGLDDDKAQYFTVNAIVFQIKSDNLVYKSCKTDKCNKKLRDLNNGLYQCEKCNKESSEFDYRLLMNVLIIDHDSSNWVTCFQEVAEKILLKSAAEIGDIVLEREDKQILDLILKEALMKEFQFKLRVRNETYNDETRLKAVVVDGKESSRASDARFFLKD